MDCFARSKKSAAYLCEAAKRPDASIPSAPGGNHLKSNTLATSVTPVKRKNNTSASHRPSDGETLVTATMFCSLFDQLTEVVYRLSPPIVKKNLAIPVLFSSIVPPRPVLFSRRDPLNNARFDPKPASNRVPG